MQDASKTFGENAIARATSKREKEEHVFCGARMVKRWSVVRKTCGHRAFFQLNDYVLMSSSGVSCFSSASHDCENLSGLKARERVTSTPRIKHVVRTCNFVLVLKAANRQARGDLPMSHTEMQREKRPTFSHLGGHMYPERREGGLDHRGQERQKGLRYHQDTL